MQNGTPTKTIVPFADVDIDAMDVLLSEDGSIPTKFTFKSPITYNQVMSMLWYYIQILFLTMPYH